MKKIREFAKLCNTTPKTLRFYDKAGVLKADYIDPMNGYRYYSEEQADWYQKIMELKQIGFTLDEIRSNFAGADDKTILALLREKEKALLEAYENCKVMIKDYEERVKMAETIENGGIYIRRMDDKQKFIVVAGERELTFSCSAEGMDACCEVFYELFCPSGYIDLDLADIPVSADEERPVLVQQVEGTVDEIFTRDVSQLFTEEDNLMEIKTALFRLSVTNDVSLDNVDDLMKRLSGCFSEWAAIIWGADVMVKDKNACKLQIVGVY